MTIEYDEISNINFIKLKEANYNVVLHRITRPTILFLFFFVFMYLHLA